MYCFFHNDADGFMSALSVAAFSATSIASPTRRKFLAIDYQDEFPLSDIQPNEEVYIVDFSISPEIMRELLKVTPYVVWIDHHKTAIEKYGEFEKEISGIRDVEHAGCFLTYKWFKHFPEQIPEAVVLVEDRDMWWHRRGEETLWFHAGLAAEEWNPEDERMQLLVKHVASSPFVDMMTSGKAIEGYRKKWARRYFDSFAYETYFEGHKAIVLNLGHWGSEAYCGEDKNYEMSIMYNHLGDGWRISLYSKSVDVSEIAKRYGGGGHKGASGFICEKLPFKKHSD